MQNKSENQKIIHLEKVNSTNDALWEHWQALNKPQTLFLYADFQSAGRGMRGNIWQSESGKNLTFSFIVTENAGSAFGLSQAASLALYDTLNALGLAHLALKWPNDVYVQGKKIAGMLIENKWQINKDADRRITASIVGIGINVNQQDFADLRATSVLNVLHKEYTIQTILKLFIEKWQIWKMYLQNTDLLQQHYCEKLLFYGIFQTYHLFSSNEYKKLKIIDIGGDGRLHLEDEAGKKYVFEYKEIGVVF